MGKVVNNLGGYFSLFVVARPVHASIFRTEILLNFIQPTEFKIKMKISLVEQPFTGLKVKAVFSF